MPQSGVCLSIHHLQQLSRPWWVFIYIRPTVASSQLLGMGGIILTFYCTSWPQDVHSDSPSPLHNLSINAQKNTFNSSGSKNKWIGWINNFKLPNTISSLGAEVEVVEHYKYLEFHLDNRTDWKSNTGVSDKLGDWQNGTLWVHLLRKFRPSYHANVWCRMRFNLWSSVGANNSNITEQTDKVCWLCDGNWCVALQLIVQRRCSTKLQHSPL